MFSLNNKNKQDYEKKKKIKFKIKNVFVRSFFIFLLLYSEIFRTYLLAINTVWQIFELDGRNFEK